MVGGRARISPRVDVCMVLLLFAQQSPRAVRLLLMVEASGLSCSPVAWAECLQHTTFARTQTNCFLMYLCRPRVCWILFSGCLPSVGSFKGVLYWQGGLWMRAHNSSLHFSTKYTCQVAFPRDCTGTLMYNSYSNNRALSSPGL